MTCVANKLNKKKSFVLKTFINVGIHHFHIVSIAIAYESYLFSFDCLLFILMRERESERESFLDEDGFKLQSSFFFFFFL